MVDALIEKKRKWEDSNEDSSSRKSTPPVGYTCNLCQQEGHWIQQCPDRRKINRRKQQKSNVHIPVPGVDPSQKDIEAAQKYQKWMVSHDPPKCFCGNLSRLKKLKKKKTQSRAAGKYFFFCATKKGDNPCRFARLVDEVMKEQNRKGKRASGVTEGSPGDSTSAGLANKDVKTQDDESSSQSKGSSDLGSTLGSVNCEERL